MKVKLYFSSDQWFPNFSGARTPSIILVLRKAQNIDLYRDLRTIRANLANHQWSAEQTLGTTAGPDFFLSKKGGKRLPYLLSVTQGHQYRIVDARNVLNILEEF